MHKGGGGSLVNAHCALNACAFPPSPEWQAAGGQPAVGGKTAPAAADRPPRSAQLSEVAPADGQHQRVDRDAPHEERTEKPVLDYRLAQLLQRARTRLTQVEGLQVVDVVLVVLGDHVQPELLSPLCRLSLLLVLLSLLLRSLPRRALLSLSTLSFVNTDKSRSCQKLEVEV